MTFRHYDPYAQALAKIERGSIKIRTPSPPRLAVNSGERQRRGVSVL